MTTTCRLTTIVLLSIALLAAPRPASADDSNYQTYAIGARAMGMAGAFTAFADDAGGEFYNPAGIAMLSGSSMSVSQTVYSYQTRTLGDGVNPPGEETETQDLTDTKIPVIPSALSLAAKFGDRVDGVKRFTASYSSFVPDIRDFSFSGIADYRSPEGRDESFRLDIVDKDRTLQHGPTIAARINKQWSVGLSLFHVYRTVETFSSGYRVVVPDDEFLTEFVRTVNSQVERKSHDLLFKIGARYDVNSNWRLGLAITPPSIHLAGSGSADITNVGTVDETDCPTECTRFRTVRGSSDNARSPTATSFRGGVGFITDSRKFAAGLDVSVHLPISYYPFTSRTPEALRPDPETGDLPGGFAVLDEIERKLVTNVNIGAEQYFGKWMVRSGFYTNFSSAPDIEPGPFAQPSNVDMYGVSFAFGRKWGETMISLGVTYSFGRGEISALRTPGPDEPAVNVFGPISEHRDYFFFFIQGASAATDKATDAVSDYFIGPSKDEKKNKDEKSKGDEDSGAGETGTDPATPTTTPAEPA